jgi:hypothetical protein
MNIFINEIELGDVYELSDVFNDWNTMRLEVDPEVAETWRETIEEYYKVQSEIREALFENGEEVY